MIFFHHNKVFIDEFGNYCYSSSIGLWLNELSKHFDISLLCYKSKIKHAYQDMVLDKNIKLINLGYSRPYLDFFKKRIFLKNILNKLKNKFDYLLIRGHTPLQIFVWMNLKVKKDKIFYLVRSLNQKRRISLFKPEKIIGFFSNKVREYQFVKIIKSTNKIITNSPKISRDLSKLIQRKVDFAYSSIISNNDFEGFNSKKRNEILNFIFVGRVSEMKGVFDLLNALLMYKRESKQNFKLTLVGTCENTTKSKINDFILKNKLKNNIILNGRVDSREELYRLYRSSDLFILPSKTEGMPRVLWEAAINSCPIIATNVGGISSVFENKKDIFLVNPNDPYAIYLAISKFEKNTDLFERLAKNAFYLAEKNTLEKNVFKLTELIRQ